jgi:hypothetical protein
MSDKKFKSYVGDPDFHDGTIRRVSRESSLLSVEVEGHSGARYLVRFTGVESVISVDPEGMVVYALDEMETEPPLREFHFANSNEPDEKGGHCKLEVMAQGLSVKRL